MRVLISSMRFSLVLNIYKVLFAGDSGAESTKFGFFNTRQQNFNTGQHFCIAHLVEKAPDSTENLGLCYEEEIAPECTKLRSSSILRVLSVIGGVRKVAVAIIQTQFPLLLPCVFMKWEVCENSEGSNNDGDNRDSPDQVSNNECGD